MNKATICLSIDDARENILSLVYRELLPKNIPATINVVTGFIDGTAENRGYPCISKEQLIDIFSTNLFEIANHGDSHKNNIEDIIKGRKKLISWLNFPKDIKLGFASPGSNMKIKDALLEQKELEDAGVLYVRTYDNSTIFDEKEKDSHAFLSAYSFAFSSVVVYKGVTPYKRLVELTEYAIKNNLTLILMLHNFAVKGEEIFDGDWTYDLDEFSKYLEYICKKREENKLNILTVKDAIKKLKK